MRPVHHVVRSLLVVLAAAFGLGASAAWAEPPSPLRARLYDWTDGVLVVAHRACHAAAPARGMPDPTPENSLAALDRCIALGVDMVEIDVRRTADGALVVMHDATVDRTTDGRGRLAALTLAQVQALRLRRGVGRGLSSEAPPTLQAYLARANGRILINLDVKEPLAAEVTRTVQQAGAAGLVLVKAPAREGAGPLADQPAYRSLAFMPMIGATKGRAMGDPAVITAQQALAENRIPAIELCDLRRADFRAVRAVARLARVRLWSNALARKGLQGAWARARAGGAAADGRLTWRRLIDDGVTVIQTNRPAALLDYLQQRGLRGAAPAVIDVALDAGSG